VPAALALLADVAAAVCRALGEPACGRLVAALVQVHGVHGGRALPAAPWPALAHDTAGAPGSAGGAASTAARPQPGGAPDAAAAAAAGSGAEPPQAAAPSRCLQALAQALHERPWAAASPGFAQAVWRRAIAAGAGEAQGGSADGRGAARPPAGAARAPRPAWAAAPAVARPAAAAAPGLGAQGAARRPPTPPGPCAATPPAVAGHPAPPRAIAAAGGPTPPHRHPVPEPALCTACAGLFFTLPLLQRQGLLGDFTQPVPEPAALHPAWLLRALLRRHAPAADADAQALAQLLGRWAGPAPRGLAEPGRAAITRWHRALQADAARALGRPPRGTLAWLLRRPGRVRLSATRLDVHFDLATHALAIRAAGLDRDPGWIPAAGRHVAFHFELP
jgi:hypothetical protein